MRMLAIMPTLSERSRFGRVTSTLKTRDSRLAEAAISVIRPVSVRPCKASSCTGTAAPNLRCASMLSGTPKFTFTTRVSSSVNAVVPAATRLPRSTFFSTITPGMGAIRFVSPRLIRAETACASAASNCPRRASICRTAASTLAVADVCCSTAAS